MGLGVSCGLRTHFYTRSGKKINILEPDLSQICFEDIVDHLSGARRYSGALEPTFYSVAQHCVVCSKIAETFGPHCVAGAFVHDFAEAYLTDIPSGVKAAINHVSDGAYRKIEDMWNDAMSEKFGVHLPWPTSVHEVDQIAFSTEARDLFPSNHPIRDDMIMNPAGIKIYAVPPELAAEMFCTRYKQLKRKGLLT